MAKGWNRFTAAAAAAFTKPGRYHDGGGLYLQLKPDGKGGVTRCWLYGFMRNGKARMMGLGQARVGSEGIVTLAKARQLAQRAREMLLDGLDPILARQVQRAEARAAAASVITFKQAAEKCIEAHRPGWRNAKHSEQWAASLESYAYPHFGHLPVGHIDTGLVLKAIEPIWAAKTETASRVRGRIEAVLDWAQARGYRGGENPARWKGHLDKLLPARSKVRKVRAMPSLPYAELPAFLADLRQRTAVAARCLEFVILTACRTNEAIGAARSEIDLENKLWIVPPSRTKAGREHRVPLSDRAVEILKALPRESGNAHVFIGPKKGRGLSNIAMLNLLKRMERPDIVPHGFRASFRNWGAERTAYPHDLLELALGHVVGDATVKAYLRSDMFEKRRRLMRDWADFCARPAKPATATPIRGRAA